MLYLCGMDANLFSRIVKELLSDTGKAVVPGLGTFAVEDVPATFSDRGFTLNPPYRNVVFVISDENDNSIAAFYAKSNGLEMVKSEGIVRSYILRLKDELRSSRTVSLPDFGKLRQAGRNCIVFVPDEGLSIFPQFDFLSPLSLKSRDFASEPGPQPSDETELQSAGNPEQASDNAEPALQASEELQQSIRSERTASGLKTAIAVIAAVALISLLALAVLGRLAPDLVDPLLYDREQLEILHKAL